MTPVTHQRIRPSRPPLRQGRPRPDRRRRAALRRHRRDPRRLDRPPAPHRLEAERRAPGGSGQQALERDLEIHRLTARLRDAAPLRAGPLPRAGRPAGSAEPLYVGRLGLTDGAGRQLLVDWRSPAAEPFFGATHANPMGLASRRRYRWTRGRISDYWDEVFTADGLDGHAAARRPVGVHRQPRRRPVEPDARRARHHPGRPGRHHPGRLARRPRRRRRPGHRQDRRRPAPHRLPALRRPAARPPPRRRAVRRPAPALPRLRRGRAAQPRRGGRADLHAARPRPRGGDGRRPEPTRRSPASRRRRAMVAAIEPAVRLYEEPPHRGHGGRDAVGRRLAQRRRLGRRVRVGRPGHPAQRGPRPGLGRAARRSSSTSTTTRRSRPTLLRRSPCDGPGAARRPSTGPGR